jgi:cytochrome c556
MKRLLGSTIIAGALVVALGWGAGNVSAQSDLEAAVKDRQATMKAQGAAVATIKKYIDGAVQQSDAVKAADDLVKIAATVPSKFPKGTATTDFPGKSGAKPAIWSEPDKFAAAAKNEQAEVAKLNAAVKSGDKAAVAAQFDATGKQGCGGCHTPYREKL